MKKDENIVLHIELDVLEAVQLCDGLNTLIQVAKDDHEDVVASVLGDVLDKVLSGLNTNFAEKIALTLNIDPVPKK